MSDIIGKSKGLPVDVSAEEIDRSLSKGLASAHEAYRRIRRGELFFAQSLLDSVRYHMVQAGDWLDQRPPQAVGFSKQEMRASASVTEAFRESYAGLDSHGIEMALMTLLRGYRQQIITLHERFPSRRSIKDDSYAVDLILEANHARA